MNTEEYVVKQSRRRRGRPPKQKKESVSVFQQSIQSSVSPYSLPELAEASDKQDEQLAYSMAEEELSSFSSLLRHILHHDRGEITQLAQKLNVSENTVYRWMSGRSEPRLVHLKNLLEALPEHSNNLAYVIRQTFPAVADALSSDVQEVPKEIYWRVMELVATLSEEEVRRWQIPQAIFEFAILHLDAERRGLSISFASLMPARADGIHSLYEAILRGNYPWPFSLESQAYLGSTTLAGACAIKRQLLTWDDLDENERLQVEVEEFEKSACAYPVLRGGRLAGVLVISSTQTGFFDNAVARQAVVEYAQLLGLAFRDDEFQPFSLLNLRPMPDLKWQRAEFSRTYINRILTYARKHTLSRQEIEMYVLREMETEFEEFGRFRNGHGLQNIKGKEHGRSRPDSSYADEYSHSAQ